MDDLKRRTTKKYSEWDLNCQRIKRIRNRQKIEAMFKRQARRAAKQEIKILKGGLEDGDYE